MLQTTTPLSDFRAACEEAIRGAKARADQLEHSLQGAVAELKDSEKTKRMPYGFDVDKGRRILANENALMQRMRDVALNAAAAQAWCVAHELPVIAILPEDVWMKVCAEKQLFSLTVNKKGETLASVAALRKATDMAYHSINDRNFLGWKRSYDTKELLRNRAKRAAIVHYFERRNKIALMLDFFPHFGQFAGYGPTEWVPISFPEPPEEFGRALLKLDGLGKEIGIVADAEAINLEPYMKLKLVEVDQRIEEIEGERRRARQRAREEMKQAFFSLFEPDPVLTFKWGNHERGPVRVIVAQYGKWPLELAAVKQAIEEDLSQIPG